MLKDILALIGVWNQKKDSIVPIYRVKMKVNKVQFPKHIETELYSLLYDALCNKKDINSVFQSYFWKTEIESRIIR